MTAYVGTSGSDSITDAFGVDSFDGGDGNDFLMGTDWNAWDEGQDTLRGGAGNDGLYGTIYSIFSGGSGTDMASVFGRAVSMAAPLSFVLDLRPFNSGLPVALLDGGRIDADVENVSFHFLSAGFGDSGFVYNNDAWTVYGSQRDDWVEAGGGDDTLYGGPGGDVLEGWIGRDVISGGTGNDYLNGGPGADNVGGGDGDDQLKAGDYAPYINTPVDNSIDTLDGGAGNDTFYAGSGDRISGGAGFDSVYFSFDNFQKVVLDLRNVTLSGGVYSSPTLSGIEAIYVQFEASGYHGSGQGSLTYFGMQSADNVVGSLYADHIRGGAGNDSLNGSAGADVIVGGRGDDMLDGGANYDIASYFDAASGVAVSLAIAGGQNTGVAGIDTLLNFEGLEGSAFADSLTGSAAGNKLSGLAGGDTLDGGGGADTLDGGAGNDVYSVDNTGDAIVEALNAGADSIYSSVTRTLDANVEYLYLSGNAVINGIGNALNNIVVGNTNGNVLRGMDGADRLNGGLGGDILYGGTGADGFVFNTALGGGNVDRIMDYSVVDDTIWLENAILTQLTATGALNGAFFRVGAAAADANDYILYNSSTGALFYDANGNAAGGAVQIATLSANLALTAADFVVI